MNVAEQQKHLQWIRVGHPGATGPVVCFGVPASFRPCESSAGYELESGLLQRLAGYTSVDGQDVEATLMISRLPREIAAGELGEIAVAQANRELVGRRDDPSGGRHSSNLIVEEPERGRIGRWKVLRYGDLAFVLEVSAPSYCQRVIANACCQIADSLVPCAEPESELAESLTKRKAGDDGRVQFDLPESWTSVPAESIGDKPAFAFIAGGEEAGCERPATICCEVIPRDPQTNQQTERGDLNGPADGARPNSALQIAASFRRQLEERGMQVAGAPLYPTKVDFDCDRAFVYCPNASDESEQTESRIDRCAGALICERADEFMILSCIGASRADSLEWWAVNRRGFEIARESLIWN